MKELKLFSGSSMRTAPLLQLFLGRKVDVKLSTNAAVGY